MVNNPIFSRSWLQMQGLNGSQMTDSPQLIGAEDGNAGNVNLNQGGTYDIYTNNHKGGDTVDIGNKNDIFARLATDKDDNVKLEGSGWTKVDDPDLGVPGGHAVYINKDTNSAVMVDGGAHVTDGQGKDVPEQLQPLRAAMRVLSRVDNNPAGEATRTLTTDGNYERVSGGTDKPISLKTAQAKYNDPSNSPELKSALKWLTTDGHFEQVAGGSGKDISLKQLQDFYQQHKTPDTPKS